MRWTATDRLLAIALQEYEDGLCSQCGQRLSEAMDDDLADEWTTLHPMRDHACTAIAAAAERSKDREHPGALRYVPGLREGYEERKAELVAKRKAAPPEPTP